MLSATCFNFDQSNKILSAICFNFDQSEIFSSGNGLNIKGVSKYYLQMDASKGLHVMTKPIQWQTPTPLGVHCLP